MFQQLASRAAHQCPNKSEIESGMAEMVSENGRGKIETEMERKGG